MRMQTAKGDRSMMITCNYCEQRFDHKPTNPETGYLQSVMTEPRQIEISDLAELLVHGGNMRIAACAGGSKDENFRTAQLIGIDCDNETHIKGGEVQTAPEMYRPGDVRRILSQNGIKASFQYGTWSNTDEHPKFRTILVLDRPITDIASYEALVDYVTGLFDEYHADRNSATVSRIFYGSGACNVEYADYDAVNSADALLTRCGDISRYRSERDAEKKSRSRRVHNQNGNHANTVSMRVVQAIKDHDIKYLKRHISAPRTTVENRSELRRYIYHDIDLSDLLGVDEGETFCCVLPGHDDTNPSAVVYRNNAEVWLYICFADCQHTGKKKTTLNIKQFLELLGEFKSEYQVYKFICEIFNIEMQRTEWSAEQLENIDAIMSAIVSADEIDSFKSLCPVASQTTKNAINTYLRVLLIAKDSISPQRNATGNIIFSMSVRQLAKASRRTETKTQAYLKVLTYHHLIESVDDSLVPPNMLKRSLQYAYISEDGKKRYHSQFYQIPSWVISHVKTVEQQGIKWREHGYRLKHLSYEEFYRSEPEEAARLYPQSGKRRRRDGSTYLKRPSMASDDRHLAISEIIISAIEEYGYCTERMVLDASENKALAERQLQRSIREICDSYGYIKRRCNKTLKEKYGIQTTGYPIVIIRDEGF